MCVYHMCLGAHGGQKTVKFLELKLQAVANCLMWALGTALPLEEPKNALNSRAISRSSQVSFWYRIHLTIPTQWALEVESPVSSLFPSHLEELLV